MDAVQERLHPVALGVDGRLGAGHGQREQVVVPEHVDDVPGQGVGAEPVEVALEQGPPRPQVGEPVGVAAGKDDPLDVVGLDRLASGGLVERGAQGRDRGRELRFALGREEEPAVAPVLVVEGGARRDALTVIGSAGYPD